MWRDLSLTVASSLTPNQQRRILDDRYLKTLSNPKMFLTNDSIVSVGKDSVTTASGKEYPADVIASLPTPFPTSASF
jgi:hypothetical protein